MDPKYKPGDIVWRYTIGVFKCTFDKFVVEDEGETLASFAYPFIFYKVKTDPDDGSEHKISEAALYPSEAAAKAAMIDEMKSQKAQHEKAILDLAAVTAKHAEEIDRLGMLLDLYEDVPESAERLEEPK